MKKSNYKMDFNNRIPFENRNFREILQFYLFECPVPGVSRRGESFYDLGWRGSGAFSKLKKEMLNLADSDLKEHYHPCKRNDLEENLKDCNNLFPPSEYCVFLKSDEKSVMQSLFKGLRNALAHGSFNVQSYNKEKFYFFENYDKYLKVRCVLKEKTLIKWRNLVISGNK